MLARQLFARNAPSAEVLVGQPVVGEDELFRVLQALLVVGQGRRFFLQKLVNRVVLQVTSAVQFSIFVD